MPSGFLGRYLRYSDRMEIYGPDLGMPHTRAMGDGLFELRLKAADGIARVFYCTMVVPEDRDAAPIYQENRQDTAKRT